jgi:hypothetical protein
MLLLEHDCSGGASSGHSRRLQSPEPGQLAAHGPEHANTQLHALAPRRSLVERGWEPGQRQRERHVEIPEHDPE